MTRPTKAELQKKLSLYAEQNKIAGKALDISIFTTNKAICKS